jgi:hypothetical protein
MQGKLVRGTFHTAEERRSPDTLEREHAVLIVNRQDDGFAKKRKGDDEDEPNCRRSSHTSSAVRLFPVRYSPDIDRSGEWHR